VLYCNECSAVVHGLKIRVLGAANQANLEDAAFQPADRWCVYAMEVRAQ
jgi:hypothetical protein